MPSDPIPITSNPPNGHGLAPNASTPSSSVSTSPQTPFFQPGPTPFRWPFGSLKSPVLSSAPMFPFDPKAAPPPTNAPTAPNAPSGGAGGGGGGNVAPTPANGGLGEPRIVTSDSAIQMDDDDGEVGELGRGWSNNRVKRAVSLSVSPAGGIFASLAADPSSVVGDKVARGQGVLRRLSLSGNGFAKSAFLSPSPPNSTQVSIQPLPSAPASMPEPPTMPTMPHGPADDSELRPPPTLPNGGGRRRFSESAGQRRRGVSPMGERILRDHGHF